MFFKIPSKEERFSFLTTATPKEKFGYGIFMWFLLFLGYMIFCTNGLIMSKMENAWGTAFQVVSSGSNGKSKTTILEAVNYTIPLARGLATVPVAWLMVKMSHKYAVILALLLNTAAFPLVFAPNFILFVIGRMIMACGGTMLIIFVQPILSSFFNLKQKGILTIFTSGAYVLGALFANLLFIDSNFAQLLNGRGKLVAAFCGLSAYFPLFGYLAFGKNFRTANSMEEQIDQEELPQNTYSGIIKEKSCGFGIVFYSFLLVASVLVSNFAPRIIEKLNHEAVEVFGKEESKKTTGKSLYTICFYVGCLFGFSLGLGNKTQYRRKPFVVAACFLSFLFGLTITYLAKWLTNFPTTATVLIYICAFLFAFFAMGIQTVILYIPHEYPINNNPKRITIFYSYLGGIGYIIFAGYYLLTAIIFDSKAYFGPILSALLITLFVALFVIFACFLKEPRPKGKMHPGDKSVRPRPNVTHINAAS